MAEAILDVEDKLEIIDPQRKIILRGMTFERQEGESGEAFESRWRGDVAKSPPKSRIIYTGHEGLSMPEAKATKAREAIPDYGELKQEGVRPKYDPELRTRVDGLTERVTDIDRRFEELLGKTVHGQEDAPPEGFDYKGLTDRTDRLEQRLAAVAGGGTSAPFDYKNFATVLGSSLSSAMRDFLGGLAEALAKAIPQAPAQSYAPPPPQYAPAPQPAPEPTASSGGSPDYGAMDYKGVRRAVFDTLGTDEAARMLLDKALLNCGNPRGEETLGMLVSRHPQQAEALRALFRKHRERIGIEKPKPPR